MTKITVVAHITAKEENIEFVKSELLKLIDVTREEEGCINYDLHQDNENPTHFVFYENWASRELLQEHLASTHLVDYVKKTEGMVVKFSLNEMTQIA